MGHDVSSDYVYTLYESSSPVYAHFIEPSD